MTIANKKSDFLYGCLLSILTLSVPVYSRADNIEYQYAYAFLASPRYPVDFTHFAYVNASAPKGGRIRVPQMGNWDSFNLISEKGRLAAGIGFWSRDENLLWDTLLVPSLDEPATHYGLLAEGIAVAEDGAWIAFKLRDEGRWHDGRPITVEDVVFSFQVCQDDASPTIRTSFKPFSVEVIGPGEVRFNVDPELRGDPTIPIRLGGIPILPKHYWDSRDITKTTVEPPLGSGPYRIGEFSVGRWLQFERVPDYWAAHLPVNRGRYNFDSVKFDYFRDDQVQTEAVKANVVDVHVENVAGTWESAYDLPAYHEGYLKKVELKLARPAGLWWPIFWNMAQPRFQDIRVREALWLLHDMEWSNKRSYGFWGHATSFFHDSELAAIGLPSPREVELLEPLRDLIPATVFTQPYRPQPNAGAGWSRENLLRATDLLKQAGWVVRNNQLIHGETGEPFHIRFVAVSPALGSSWIPFKRQLERLGITASIKSPEISNWLYRMQSGDFDAGSIWFLPNNTPTLHIANSWSSTEADQAYGSNWSNLKDPAVDSLIKAISRAKTWDDYVAAVRAFDRVMLLNYYWIPMASKTRHAIAYWDKYGIPDQERLVRLAFIDTWWWDGEKASRAEAFTGGNE
jgi:microcin C transport system substrate-binding protein